jgi:YggT family protein
MLLSRTIGLVFSLYSLAIILRAFLPWFGVGYYHPVLRFCVRVTEPLLAPLRRVVPSVGGLDLTPMVALLALWLVEMALRRAIGLLL